MDDMPGRRLLTASLFGGGGLDELTRDQSELDGELQKLIEQARSRGETSRDEIIAQVVEIAKKYPDIVNLQSLGVTPWPSVVGGGREQPAEMSGNQALPSQAGAEISGAEVAPHPHSSNEAPILPAKKRLQSKYNKRIQRLRELLWKNNTELRKGNKPKVFQGEAYNNTPAPYKQKIEQLLEAIDMQVRLYAEDAGLQESATKSGISEFWSKWPENKWMPSVVDSYREQLKEQHAAVVKALGSG